MDTVAFIGIVSGLLALSSYFFYIPAILSGKTKPNRASWWIWGGIGALIVASYYASGARGTIWVPVSEAVGPAIIALLSIKYGEGGWTRLDRWCIAGAVVGSFLWWFTDSPVTGLLFYLFTDFMAVIPTLRKSYHRPEHEDKTAWGLVFAAQFLNIFAVERVAFSLLVYPIYMTLTNGVVFALQFKKRGERAFSSIDVVSQCLSDIPRTQAFQCAIRTLVKKDDTVLDCGSGSGILALFAAQAGARRVVSLEYDPFIAEAARRVISANSMSGVVDVRVGDGRTYAFEPGLRFDVVIMEMLTTGMIDECQVWAVNNLHRRGAVGKETVFIPSRQDTFATLGYFDFVCYGFTVPFVRHLWRFYHPSMRPFTPLSNALLVHSLNFSQKLPERCEAVLDMRAAAGGVVNAIRLESTTVLTKDISLGDTDSLSGPVVIPVPETRIAAGQSVRLAIRYPFGRGFENVHVTIEP